MLVRFQFLYHIVFSTKNREPWLDDDIRERTHEYLGGAVRVEGGTGLIVNGTADCHVHILARLRQDKAVSDLVRDIKSNASGWIHRTFEGQDEFQWQAGYGAFTVSVAQVEKVRHSIQTQEEHHRRHSFTALLKAHGVEYDERYLWT